MCVCNYYSIIMSKFDIQKFIYEIQSRRALWDWTSVDYMNRDRKQECWLEICRHFNNQFNSLPPKKQNEIGLDYQKKWKSLRTSFTRELSRKRCPKSKTEKLFRKTYIYYDLLTFLEPVVNKKGQDPDDDTSTSKTNEDTDKTSNMTNNSVIDSVTISNTRSENIKSNILNIVAKEPVNISNTLSANSKQDTDAPSRKRVKLSKDNEEKSIEEKILALLDRNLHQRIHTERELFEDPDRSFLLSLVKTLKSIPPIYKFDAQIEILNVLKKYANIARQAPYVDDSQPSLHINSNDYEDVPSTSYKTRIRSSQDISESRHTRSSVDAMDIETKQEMSTPSNSSLYEDDSQFSDTTIGIREFKSEIDIHEEYSGV